MEVKPGYKQTEVGVIPEEWDVPSLEGIADPKRPICYGIVQVGPFARNGIPVLAIKNLNTDYLTNVHRSSPEVETQYARSRVRPGDVLISVKGTTGRVGIVPQHFAGNISRDLARLRLTDEDVPEFWFQMLQSETAQRKLGVAMVGTTRMELSIGILKQVRMPRPPKEEQRTIAGVLSDLDVLIGALDRLIAKKRDLKQAAMQQLLTGQTRLPGFSGEWEEKPLSEIASATKGTQLRSSKPSENGLFAHLNGGITPSGYAEKANTPGSTIAISEGGNSCGYVQFMAEPYWCGGHCYSVVPIGIDNCFLYHALKARQTSIMALRVGSGLPNVQKTALLAFKLTFPTSAAEQTAIAMILSDLDAEIVALETKLAKARQIKQGMMHNLLTGRIRLV